MDDFSSDVVIIGAGPVGLFAVFQCGMLGLSCQVVDALETIGGQCAALYPEKPIYDIPAQPSISGADLIEQLERQAAPFNPVYHLRQTVEGLQRSGGGFMLTTSAGITVRATVVIIAAGAGAFGPNRPPLQGLEAFENSGAVQYCVRGMENYRDKKVVIAGGGDSAVDWALALQPIAASVQVVHRRPKFRAAPESVRKMQELAEDTSSGLELVVPYQLSGLQGQGGALEAVEVATLDGQTRQLEADILLPFFGLSTDLSIMEPWGLGLSHHHIPIKQDTAATSVDGIFAVGDVATYTNKLKLILCGFAEAAQAAHSAYALCHPDTALHFTYSTSKGVPGVAA